MERIASGPLPSGVSLGRDFWKKGVEEKRDISAARVVERLSDMQADLCLIEYSKRGFLELPLLADGEEKSLWAPRYDPVSGAIYTSRWKYPEVFASFEGQRISRLENYSVFGGKKLERYRASLYGEYLPKSWKVVQIVPQLIEDGIEAALRQQDEIVHDYGRDGVECAMMEEILKSVDEWALEIKEDTRTSFELLKHISGETERLLTRNGIGLPDGVLKKKIYYAMTSAANKDSLGRVNKLISRTLLASAYLNAVRGAVIGNLSESKAQKTISVLSMERETTRRLMEDGLSLISSVAGFERGISQFHIITDKEHYENHPDEISNDDITNNKLALRGIARRCFRPVKAAPYLLFARMAEAWLTDINMLREEDRRRITTTLSHYECQQYANGFSAEEQIRMRHPKRMVDRLRQTHSLVDSVLKDPDNAVYTVFSNQ
jgi:hypothetical protein